MKYKKTITAISLLGIMGAGAFSAIHFNLFKIKETKIISFKSNFHCENSSLSKELPLSCDSVNKVAMVTASNYKWNIPNMNTCYRYYGKKDCGINAAGEVSIKPVGFSYIPDEKIILPVYYSASLSMHLLPNGYPIKLGNSVVLGKDIVKNISMAKALDSMACYNSNEAVTCGTRHDLLNKYDRHLSENRVFDYKIIIGIATGVSK
jgi:hypothetical protein